MFHLSLARSVSSVAAIFLLFASPAWAQAPAAPALPPSQAPASPAMAQSPAELREELQRLRAEFESIRDAYGARLAALEARLSQQPGGPAPAAAPPASSAVTPPPAAGQAQVPEVAVPAGAAGAGGPAGVLPV